MGSSLTVTTAACPINDAIFFPLDNSYTRTTASACDTAQSVPVASAIVSSA